MRKTIFWLHLVSGVTAGLVIFIMSLTGTLLMYQKQLTAWADGAQVTPPANATRLPVETLLAKVREKESAAPSAVTISSLPDAPASFSFGREKTIFVNPYTGELLGEGSKTVRAFFQSMIEWHRWLGTDGDNRPLGKAITGACNLAFFFLVLSGFYLWWPRKWNWRALKAVTVFDGSLSGKARDWNWHNVIGFWTALPLAVLVFTATFFSYPWATEWLYRAMGEEPPAPRSPAPSGQKNSANGPSRESKKEKESPTFAGLNDAWARAEQQVPGWRTITLRLPGSATAPLPFTIDKSTGARPDLRATLTLNAASGEIEKWEPYTDNSPARKVRLWVRWIHTGEAGGFIGQTIAGVASAGGAVLVYTGFALAFRRFTKRKQNAARSKAELEAVGAN